MDEWDVAREANPAFLLHSDSRTQGPGDEEQPELPAVPEGGFLIVSGDPQDAAGIAPLVKLMELFAVEKDRLIEAHTARLKYLQDAEEWKKLQPSAPQPVNRTFWIRPHRGSRYLQTGVEGGAR